MYNEVIAETRLAIYTLQRKKEKDIRKKKRGKKKGSDTRKNKTTSSMRNPIIFLASTYLATAVFFGLQPIPTVGFPATNPSDTEFIRTSCGTTLYPTLCYTSLSRYASAIQQSPAQLALVAIRVSLSKAKHMTVYVSNLTRQADYGADPRATSALHDCSSNFADAVDEITGSVKQMRRLGSSVVVAGAGAPSEESIRFQISNVQTWMSAALTDQDTCTDGFEDVAECPLKKDVCDRTANVKKFTSNALALVNSYAQKTVP